MTSIVEIYQEKNADLHSYARHGRSRGEFQMDIAYSAMTLGIPDFYFMAESLSKEDYGEARYQATTSILGLAPWYVGYQGVRAYESLRYGRAIGMTFAEVLYGKKYLLRQGLMHGGRAAGAYIARRIPAITAMGVLYAAGNYLQSLQFDLSGMHIGDIRFVR